MWLIKYSNKGIDALKKAEMLRVLVEVITNESLLMLDPWFAGPSLLHHLHIWTICPAGNWCVAIS
jgi:hypothetical protein